MALVNLPFTDTGRVPLVYDTSRAVIQQSPSWIATYAAGSPANVYGPGDVFLEGDRVVTYAEALARAQALAGGSAPPTTPPTTTPGGSTPTQSIASAIETTISEFISAMMRPIWPGNPNSIPMGAVVLGGVLLLKQFGRKRR